MTITYTSGTFEVCLKDQERITTPATLASNGLCYHPARNAKIQHSFWLDSTHGLTAYADAYTVSHVASGQMLCGNAEPFQTEEQCRMFIACIDSLADWLSESPVLSEKTKQQAYAYREQIVRKEATA